MANEDKFAKTIDDEELDEVAGGIGARLDKDIKFLRDLGVARLDKNSSKDAVEMSWITVGGIRAVFNKSGDSSLYYQPIENPTTKIKRLPISRNDAMIMAMRKQNKYLDLEKYV